MDRVWTLDGVWNFRDFGGYPTTDERRVRAGRLFRSAHFSEASARDIARLDTLNAALVLDLRAAREREEAPSLWPAARGPRALVRPAPAVPQPAAPLTPGPFSADIARANMVASYRRIPADRTFTVVVGDFLRALAETGGPAVIHCTSGKDRTGVVCAVLLSVLGVDRETVFADYELTNVVMDVRERRRGIREALAPEVDRTLTDDDIAPLLGVEPGYLQVAWERIDQDGGMDRYAETRLGVSPRVRAALRSRLLE